MKIVQLPHIVTIVLLYLSMHSNAQISINEFQASNTKTNFLVYPASYPSGYPDWIELKNSSTTAVDISGYYLSDNSSVKNKWSFPTGTTIPAKGYLLVFANDKNFALQTNFKLSSFGDELILSAPDLTGVDSIKFSTQYQDLSYGRKADGTWAYFKTPTPKLDNNDASAFYSYIDGPVISLTSGIYNTPQTIELTAGAGCSIYYTLDGSMPTSASTLYTGPIYIATNTVLKAVAVSAIGSSLVEGSSYVFGASHSLPVIMLTSANERKVYVEKKLGKYDVDGRVRFEYIEPGGKKAINQYAKFEASGYSSSRRPQLNGKLKPAYDKNEFKYKFFENKPICEFPGGILLRNASQDNASAHMRDAVFSRIIGDDAITDNFYFEGYRPAVLYVDGVYEGIIEIREDNDKAFAENNFQDVNAEIAPLTTLDDLDYSVESNRVFQQNTINIHDIINNAFLKSFIQAAEWEANITVKVPGRVPNYVSFIHDTDFGFGLEKYFRSSIASVGVWGLPDNIKNYTPYKQEAAQYTCALFNNVLDSSRTLAIVNDVSSKIRSEINAHVAQLWNTTDYEVSMNPYYMMAPKYTNEAGWQKNVDTLKMYFQQVNNGIYDYLKTVYGYSNQITIKSDVSALAHGNIRIHGIKVVQNGKVGTYFSGIPLDLEAVPQPGYRFSHWEGAVSGTTSKITATFVTNSNIKAVFEPIPFTLSKLHINEIQSVNDSTVADEFGEFNDWVEIYNKELYPVNLAGYYVSDDTCNLRKWKIRATDATKTTVNPGAWLVLWADKDTLQGPNHLNFKFDNSEQFILTYPNGITIADSITFKLSSGESLGSVDDGAAVKAKFLVPTPGKTNKVITGLNEGLEDGLSIYPNPTTGNFIIKAASDIENIDIQILSLDGRILKQISQHPISTAVQLTDLREGMYIVSMKAENLTSIKKLIKL
jgi:hypothetical protein